MPFEAAAVNDQHPVEQFTTYGADPAFGDRVRSWRSHWGTQNADALALNAHETKDQFHTQVNRQVEQGSDPRPDGL